MNIYVQVSVDMFSYLFDVKGVGMLGSYGNSMFNHLRNCQAVF